MFQASGYDVGSLGATLELDRTPFNRGLQQARADAANFERQKYQASVGIDSAAARAELDRLKAEDVKVSGNVDLDDAAAVAKVDRLRTKDADVHGNYDLDIGAAEAKIALLKRQAAGIGGGIGGGGVGGGGGGNFIGPGQGPLSFLINHPVLGGLAAGAPFLPTIGASAAQGVLGVGALGTGLLGAGAVGGAGILATAIPAITGLKGAYEAYSLQQKQAAANAIQSAQQQLQASAAAQQAAEQVSTAQTNLARARVAGDQAVAGAEEQLQGAQQAETIAQRTLTQARADAVRQLQDMRRAAIESVTAEQQAQINLQVARRALAQAPAGASGLELRQLQLNVTEARQALTDAHIARKRSNEDANKAERQGVQGMPQVVAAQRQLQQAHQGAADAATALAQAETQARQSVKDAQRQVSDALRAQSLQAKEASLQAQALAASNDKLGYAMSKLPPAGQEVFHMLVGLRDQWHQLSLPAQNQFFGMLSDGIHTAEQQLPSFARSAETSVGAARGAFDHFLGIFNTPDFHTFETTMTQTFAAGIGPFERGIENIAHVLSRIAVASAPDVLRMLNGFQEVTHGWEQNTRDAGHLQHEVHGTVQQFGDWFDLATSLGHLLAALFLTNEQGAKRGGQEVEAVSRQLDQWARWIEHHHHDINSFFGQLNDDVGLLLGSAGQIASVVLPAFKPVGDIIHEIVTDLNSIKIGNVSALTVLLGIMAARGIGGKLGLVGGSAAAGGLSAGEAAAAGGGGGLSASAIAGRAGAFLLEHPMAGPTAAGAGAAVAFQSLAGKPGTFLGPGIAGLVPDAGDFTHAIRQDLRIQQSFHNKSLSQLEDLRAQAQAQWQRMWETDPATAQSAGAEAMVRAAHDTARQIRDQIRGMKLGTEMADAVGSGKGDVRKILRDYEDRFEALPPVVQDAAVKSAKTELDQLQEMGLITKKQERQTLNDLEDMQAQSQRQQRQKWDQFGQNVNHLVSHWFGSMTGTVDTLLGNKGITGMVNQLLTGVASQHKLKWNATTLGRTAGTLAGFLGIGSGGQHGGFTGGWSSFDDRMVPMRGNEAILRGEDHVPMVDASLRRDRGFGLGDMFARTGGSGNIGSGFADGGFVGMQPAIISLAKTFLSKFGGVMSSGFRPGDPGFHGRGLAADIVPSDWGGATRYANQIGSQLLEGIHQGPPGSDVSWDSGHQVPPSFWGADIWAEHISHIHMATENAIKGAVGAAVQRLIPKIAIHGPRGGIHDGLQGIADHARAAANRYLERQRPAMSTDVRLAQVPKGLPPSLRPYNYVWAEHQAPDYGGPTMPFNKIAELAEWAGSGHVPGVTMAQVTKGESGSRPGSSGVDPGGTRGYGLWAITTGVGNDAMINALGGPKAMLNPIVNAEAMAKIYAGSGLGAWYGTGFVTDPNAHYTGPMKHGGGMISPFGSARVHPPEILVPGGPHGTDVLSQEDTMRLLRKAARDRGHGIPDIKLIVKGDIVSQHADPVEAVIGDRRFPVAVQREITGRRAHARQLTRMHDR